MYPDFVRALNVCFTWDICAEPKTTLCGDENGKHQACLSAGALACSLSRCSNIWHLPANAFDFVIVSFGYVDYFLEGQRGSEPTKPGVWFTLSTCAEPSTALRGDKNGKDKACLADGAFAYSLGCCSCPSCWLRSACVSLSGACHHHVRPSPRHRR
jgi:hypothetical protein